MTYGKLIINGEFRDNGFTVEYNSLYLNDELQKDAIFEYLNSLYSVLNNTLVKDIEFFEHLMDEIGTNFELTYYNHKMFVHDKKLILLIL